MSWKEAVAWHHVSGSLKRSQERLRVQAHPSCNGDPRLEIPRLEIPGPREAMCTGASQLQWRPQIGNPSTMGTPPRTAEVKEFSQPELPFCTANGRGEKWSTLEPRGLGTSPRQQALILLNFFNRNIIILLSSCLSSLQLLPVTLLQRSPIFLSQGDILFFIFLCTHLIYTHINRTC